ncbi:MAG: prolipoprotein diacylglyceryl transferase [Chloroflexi bacterium]|nr:prolipoprotein diacylglyceryl transferase [Chloroflexota bacterium]
MHPILLRYGSFSLYSYSAMIWLGIVSAIAYVQWQCRRISIPSGSRREYFDLQVLDGALWTLAGGLIGARLAYVAPNWADYAGRPAALFNFWGGGLVFQGGLLGGLLALLLYSLFMELPFCHLIDLAAPAVSLAQALGWVGAWLHGANYGLIIRSPLSVWAPDLYGVYGPRVPTQALACALGIVLFWGLHRLSRFHLRPGSLGLIYLFSNGIGHFLLEFTRADEAPYLGLLRMTQVAELIEAVIAVVLLYLWLRRKPIMRRRSG